MKKIESRAGHHTFSDCRRTIVKLLMPYNPTKGHTERNEGAKGSLQKNKLSTIRAEVRLERPRTVVVLILTTESRS